MKRYTRLLSWFLFMVVVLLMPIQFARAANPLLYAANASQLNTAIDTANGLSGADTIILTANITLTSAADVNASYGNSGLKLISSDITIEGQGHTIARSTSAPSFRIFRLVTGANLTLVNLTVTKGVATSSTIGSCDLFTCGGGIYNEGTLILQHTTFSENVGDHGGGVYQNMGSVAITDSTFVGNGVFGTVTSTQGGGLDNEQGSAVITDSLFSGNRADEGGGVMNFGGSVTITGSAIFDNSSSAGGGVATESDNASLTIQNSTFSYNSAFNGGGIYNLADDIAGDVVISNSTFSYNSAESTAGGIWNKDGNTIITNSTFYGNSSQLAGGIYNITFSAFTPSTITVKNSIIANSTGENCVNSPSSMGSITAVSSLTDDDTCTDPGFTNSPSINLDDLIDNGGPTPTQALLAGSSALDAADNAICTTSPISGFDQRGVLRGLEANGIPNDPAVGDCDIGAFEQDGASTRLVEFLSPASSVLPASTSSFPVTLTLDEALEASYAPIQVYIWVSGGTATAGVDYAPFGLQTVTFTPGDTTKTVTLNLLNFSLTTDKTVILSFAIQNGPGYSGPVQLGGTGGTISHTVTISGTTANAGPEVGYFTTHTPTLTWNRIANAIGYEIQIDTDTAFAAPYADSSSTIPADLLNQTTEYLENGVYYWRVRALLPHGDVSGWSTTQSFRVFVP